MNNINIKNIFVNNNSCNISDNSNINNISINNLVESNTFKISISDEYIINKIKVNKENQVNKIKELYETKYKECLLKINNALELNLTDILFSVDLNYFGYPQYKSIDCLKYIEKKLKNKKFLTLLISQKDIFVSWKNIIDS